MSSVINPQTEFIRDDPDIATLAGLPARLHWSHWLVVFGAFIMTFVAWKITSHQATETRQNRFDSHAEKTIHLVVERMAKYEQALQSGIAVIHTISTAIDREQWQIFAKSLETEDRYLGIKGIGLIHHISPDKLSSYLSWQRQLQGDFHIHPTHQHNDYWPISYIEPQNANQAAVGLDIAHEANRYTAAKRARDLGLEQITGPIVLVQDAQQTPGFLFYSPWYSSEVIPQSLETRRQKFKGLVYAPFIVENLMDGTLTNRNRMVNFSIKDEGIELYNELNERSENYDASPLLSTVKTIEIYGRTWEFEIQSSTLFRSQQNANQALIILVGGIILDSSLLILFIILANANKRAINYANKVTLDLQSNQQTLVKNNRRLVQANEELNQFTYIASHDLKEPLRTARTFTGFLLKNIENKNWPRVEEDVLHLNSAITRMSSLVSALLALSHVNNDSDIDFETVTLSELTQEVLASLDTQIQNSQADISIEDQGILFYANRDFLLQALQNLISNSINYTRADSTPEIIIRTRRDDSTKHGIIEVEDKGIGIAADQLENIFQPFKRLHSQQEYHGTGIGLAIVRRVVNRHGGSIAIESTPNVGTCISLSLPLKNNKT